MLQLHVFRKESSFMFKVPVIFIFKQTFELRYAFLNKKYVFSSMVINLHNFEK